MAAIHQIASPNLDFISCPFLSACYYCYHRCLTCVSTMQAVSKHIHRVALRSYLIFIAENDTFPCGIHVQISNYLCWIAVVTSQCLVFFLYYFIFTFLYLNLIHLFSPRAVHYTRWCNFCFSKASMWINEVGRPSRFSFGGALTFISLPLANRGWRKTSCG